MMLQLDGDFRIDMRKDFGVSVSHSQSLVITDQPLYRKEEVAATAERTSLIVYTINITNRYSITAG